MQDGDLTGMHCFVAGRVQGVWFRAGTQEQAVALGITGWVQNLPDGRVEVFACGQREALEVLLDWLQQGPLHAEVTSVDHTELPWKEFDRFSVK